MVCGCPTGECHCYRYTAANSTLHTITFYANGGSSGWAGPSLTQEEAQRMLEQKRTLIRIENKYTHRAFCSRKAGLPHMFRKWYR